MSWSSAARKGKPSMDALASETWPFREGGEEEFGGRHAFVGAAVVEGLIDDDLVAAGFGDAAGVGFIGHFAVHTDRDAGGSGFVTRRKLR